MIGSGNSREHHVAFGRHSCIPECCIQWWVDTATAAGAVARATRNRPENPFGYVPCPACFEDIEARRKERPIIHQCNLDDPGCAQFYKWWPDEWWAEWRRTRSIHAVTKLSARLLPT